VSDPAKQSNENQLGDVVTLVKTYVRQETVGPLKGIGRWLAFGVAGAFMLGLGLILVVLGLLRLLQNEATDTFDGNWSIIPYVIALVVCVVVVALSALGMKKDTLQRKETSR
jgi:hypothetical protein